MIKITISLLLLIFTGCFYSKPKNLWIYTSSSSFKSYQKNLLSGNYELAKIDLKRSIEKAKQGADFNTLAKIYLGKCALNNSLGINDNCNEYIQIQDLITSKNIKTYYHLINKNIKQIDTNHLPKVYKPLVDNLKKQNYLLANDIILNIDSPTSKLISIYILDNNVSKEVLKKSIEFFSYLGYKKATIHLMKLYKSKIKDEALKSKIDKKIKILSIKKES